MSIMSKRDDEAGEDWNRKPMTMSQSDPCRCGHAQGWHDTLLGRCQRWTAHGVIAEPGQHVSQAERFKLCPCMQFVSGAKSSDAIRTR